MSSAVAKTGWLHRQTTFLRRWKRNWFVLGVDGLLRYYEQDNSLRAEDAYFVSREVVLIISGNEVDVRVHPPENRQRGMMIELKLRDGRTSMLCAESEDDAKAWHFALEQARVYPMFHQTMTACPPASGIGYPGYPQPMYANQYGLPATGSPYDTSYLVPSPNGGMTTVIMQRNPNRYGYGTGNMAMGMVAGAALGTMMWTPFLW